MPDHDCPEEKPRIVVDADWKDQVQRDKEHLEAELKKSFERKTDLPKPDFMLHCVSLGTQALIFLGALAHPETGQVQTDLEQARFLIDTLSMLQAKTQGNLSTDESQSLENLIGDLKLEWVKAVNRPSAAAS